MTMINDCQSNTVRMVPPMTQSESNARSKIISDRLNASCFCMTLDRAQMCETVRKLTGDATFCAQHVVTRPHLFSNVPVFLPAADVRAMQEIVSAIVAVSSLPAYRARVLSWAPEAAREDHGPAGALMGYDFHLGEGGPRLIEINTNAGGAVLNAVLAQAQQACCPEMTLAPGFAAPREFAAAFIAMFEAEWRLQRGDVPLRRVAIVDDQPEAQYLYPEFLLAQRLFETAGIAAEIADPRDLTFGSGKLALKGEAVDLVYNRLVDFALEAPEHSALRAAYDNGAVVVTPNPHCHALFADKRNLTVLSNSATLADLGVPEELIAPLSSIPRTVLVTRQDVDELWRQRKSLFFKPTRGHGSKAVYRGDKITRSVWEDITTSDYVAQAYAAPGERVVKIDGVPAARKMDVRLYCYGTRTLLIAARLYQGQTTNFRTPGGGFAPVFVV